MIEKNWTPSLRSQFVTARTYCRPKNEDGTIFEDSVEMVDRTIDHQRNLWEAAKGQMKGLSRVPLNEEEEAELQELKQAILQGEGSLAGRTMWLGGTDVAKRFHASNFNCSYLDIKTVYDVVDAFHLLLLGCVHPDTQILDTKGNSVRIGDLKPNQEILTFDVNTGRNENGYVLALRYSDRDTKFEIKFSDGSSVRVTDNHEFYLSDGRLVKTQGIRVGDSMLGGNSLTVSSIEEVKDSERYIDITVGNLHNFVLSNGVVTHNCGVGFSPKDGVLNGFSQPFRPIEGEISGFRKKVQVEVIRSTRTDRGYEFNREELYHDSDGNYIWHLKVGDSGLAWAKAAGKILAMKHPVDKIILDFSEIRPGGKPLRGFGWISSGDEQISEAFEAICNILVKRSDQLLTKIDILDVMNWLGSSLSSRRSAEMAMMPAEDLEAEEFTIAKKDYWTTGNKQRGQSNNSIVFHHKPTKRELRGIFSQMIASGGSEPGFVNGAAAKKRAPWYSGLNPCLTGDTLVYVADGRGTVTIKDLVEEEKDVPVFCYNEKGEVVVRTMRNPRLTGKNEKIYKVTLDNGNTLRTTGNHKFLLSDGEYKEVKDLSPGDSLKIISNNLAAFGEDCIWIENNKGNMIAEHQVIAEFHYIMNSVESEYVVHHKDKNTQNNSPDNLMIVSKDHYDKEDYFGFTQEDLKSLALDLTKSLGRKFTIDDWQCMAKKTGAPEVFSGWRKNHLGGVLSLAEWAALQCSFIDTSKMDYHTLNKYKKLLDEGYNCQIKEDGKTFVILKFCEHCGKEMKIPSGIREWGYCSGSCANQHKLIKFEFDDNFDQKVLSVVEDGFEDVYNGTVDDFHNFFVGGFVSEDNFGKRKTVFVNNRQCGEILLGDKSFCNLITIALPRFNGRFEDLERAYWLFSRANYRQTCVDLNDGILQRTWHELNQFLRLTGAGAAGIVQWEHHSSPEHIRKLRDWTRKGSDSMADELNLPRSKAITTIKPDGCLDSSTRVKTSVGNLPLMEIFSRSGYTNLKTLATGFHPVKEEIYVWDHNNQKQHITKLFNNGFGKLCEIQFEDGEVVRATPKHKFYMKDGSWKQTKEIQKGDVVLRYTEGQLYEAPVRKVFSKSNVGEDLIQSLDIEVENTHSYQLSTGLISHNTVGKKLDVSEGIHRPLGKYIMNNIIVSKASPMYQMIIDANYRVMDHPFDNSSAIISMPVAYEGEGFTKFTLDDGKEVEVNMETAVDQLNRYRLWMKNYVDHNCSITVSYSQDEVEEIVEWLHKYWDDYVGVSWMFRVDPLKLAEDPAKIAAALGYPYLPQYPITKNEYEEYTSQLLPIDLNSLSTINSLDALENDCAGGVCPIR